MKFQTCLIIQHVTYYLADTTMIKNDDMVLISSLLKVVNSNLSQNPERNMAAVEYRDMPTI